MLAACSQAPVEERARPAVVPPDVTATLKALGAKYLAAHPAAAETTDIRALGPCKRPSTAERAAITRRVQTWIDRTSAGVERRDPDPMLAVSFGCVEAAGIVVGAQEDRRLVKSSRTSGYDVGHWWTLRVSRDAIRVLAHTGGTAMDNFMEWASETSRATIALADLDRDGTLDPITVVRDHEGGSIASIVSVDVTPSRSGTLVHVATFADRVEPAALQPASPSGPVALAIWEHEGDRTHYRCIGPTLALTVCPASIAARRGDTALAAARRLQQLVTTPDREDLAELLAAIDVPAADRIALVAAAPVTPPVDSVTRRIAAFVHPVDERTSVERRADAERAAQATFAAVRTDLGIAACAAVAGDPGITAWIRATAARATAITLTARCGGSRGAYVAATWQIGTKFHEGVFFVARGKVTRVATAEQESIGDPTQSESPRLAIAMHRRGDLAVAIVLESATDDSVVLTTFVDGKPVTRRPGHFRFLTIDEWSSDAIVAEDVPGSSCTRYWQAGASELVELACSVATSLTDPALAGATPIARRLDALVRRRLARDHLEQLPQLGGAERASTIEALATLGADRALIDAVTRLP
ncbi:MAG: hypothetical protein ABI867_19595 [Kofleriaceae bacterium]